MPTPEEKALYQQQLAALNAEHPGEYNIILDAGDDADWLHEDGHVPGSHYDVPLAEQERVLQEALEREPTGPEPPEA
jgi:hypothetical protein